MVPLTYFESRWPPDVLSSRMATTQTYNCTSVYERGELAPRERDNFTCQFCGAVLETFAGASAPRYRLLVGPDHPAKIIGLISTRVWSQFDKH